MYQLKIYISECLKTTLKSKKNSGEGECPQSPPTPRKLLPMPADPTHYYFVNLLPKTEIYLYSCRLEGLPFVFHSFLLLRDFKESIKYLQVGQVVNFLQGGINTFQCIFGTSVSPFCRESKLQYRLRCPLGLMLLSCPFQDAPGHSKNTLQVFRTTGLPKASFRVSARTGKPLLHVHVQSISACLING